MKIPAFLRVQDRFLQFARKYWRGMRLTEVLVEEEDRVLILKGFKERKHLRIYFFWRGRDLFFAHEIEGESQIEVFQSWVGKQKVSAEAREGLGTDSLFHELDYGGVKNRSKQNDFEIDEYLESFEKKVEIGEAIKNKKLKTVEKMKQELKRFDVLDYLERQTKEDLEKVKTIGEGRFKVIFKGLEGHFKKREYLFDKVKGWRKSQAQLKTRMDALELEAGVKTQKKENAFHGKIVEPVWNYKVEKESLVKKQNYIKFQYNEWSCYLGRTALENDQIRKEIAKKEDWWIHLENYKSGHLFVKSDGGDLLPDDLTTLSSALVELNNIELQEIPLIFTKVKNLKGVKGAPGMVNFKKEKHLTVFFDPEWRQKLTKIEVDGEG